MTVQTVCAEFAGLLNGLRRLKHEVAGKKREPLPQAVVDMLTAHQADLQTLETTARDLWVALGSKLVPATMPEMTEEPRHEARPTVRVVPVFPAHAVEAPPPNYLEGVNE